MRRKSDSFIVVEFHFGNDLSNVFAHVFGFDDIFNKGGLI